MSRRLGVSKFCLRETETREQADTQTRDTEFVGRQHEHYTGQVSRDSRVRRTDDRFRRAEM